jgi:hypothetical protein
MQVYIPVAKFNLADGLTCCISERMAVAPNAGGVSISYCKLLKILELF